MKDLFSPIKSISTRDLIVNKNYEKVLQLLGLNYFDAIWQYPHGELVKETVLHSVVRTEMLAGQNKKLFYLKRHNDEYTALRAMAGWCFPGFISAQGPLEYNNILRFREKGLATVIPVAAGQRRRGLFHVESFLITVDFSPYISLETFLKVNPQFFMGKEGRCRKKKLIEKVASLARQMHENGFNHQDFNATHILLYYEGASDMPKLALFDLQRVETGFFSKFRWGIKSLARLNYSLPDEVFTLQDRISLLTFYKGKSRLNILDRCQWYWISKKTKRIRRHTEKKRASGKVRYGPNL
ncbi:heptose I phosphotransferase [Desulfosalsimonas propionicica]|uniref:Heptose I phosphotransferase n=1 Tax=Desulfosalsimonas propionicica TaxID=332175 RepID=A0A7W0C7X7_9BACT|nr:lipopolysaccharide kinase InaA family protein [Desulfosalsimonas propionicica]MBA2880793.1 heptose I phosphotransferase [Desulfosalsimonas propionicica]